MAPLPYTVGVAKLEDSGTPTSEAVGSGEAKADKEGKKRKKKSLKGGAQDGHLSIPSAGFGAQSCSSEDTSLLNTEPERLGSNGDHFESGGFGVVAGMLDAAGSAFHAAAQSGWEVVAGGQEDLNFGKADELVKGKLLSKVQTVQTSRLPPSTLRAFYQACCDGDQIVVQQMLKIRVDVEKVCEEPLEPSKMKEGSQEKDQYAFSFACTPLQLAAWYGKVDVVRLLLDSGARLNNVGSCPEVQCISTISTISFKALKLREGLRSPVGDGKIETATPSSARCCSCLKRMPPSAQSAPSERSAQSAPSDSNALLCWTPLHMAAHQGHTKVVELLIEKKGSHGAKDYFQRTPLALATGACGKIIATTRTPNKQIEREDLIMLLHKEGKNATEIIDQLMEDAVAVDSTGRKSVKWKGEARLAQRLQVITCQRYAAGKGGAGEGGEGGPGEGGRRSSMSRHFPITQVLDADLDLPTLDINLFYAPEVKVVLKALPYFSLAMACDRTLLHALANTGNEATLATDTVHAMIEAAWAKVRNRTAAEIMLNVVNVALLCYVSLEFRAGSGQTQGVLYILTFIHMKMTLEEVVQQLKALVKLLTATSKALLPPKPDSVSEASWRSVHVHPFMDIDQFTDLGYQIIGCVALFRQFANPTTLEKPFMALFSAMAWFRLSYCLRGEPWFGPRMLPILFALRDTVVFFFFAAVCVCAATHAYYNLELQDEYHRPLYAALLQVVRLGIFGDFDIFEFEGVEENYALNETTQEFEAQDPERTAEYRAVQVLFFGTGLGITILLMNLLIGVLSSNFDLYQDRAPELFNRARAKLLLEIEGRPTVALLNFLQRKRKEEAQDRTCLYFLLTFLWRGITWLQTLFHSLLLLLALPLILILIPFCSWTGTYHTILRIWKTHVQDEASDRNYIWVVKHENSEGVELRSLHALVKDKVNRLEDSMQEKLGKLDEKMDKLSKLEEKMDQVLEAVKPKQ